MEKVTFSTKRKKRRTRRCLNEIRNRLRRKCGNSFEHSMQNNKSCILESKKLDNRLVTTDRLTLKSMFPNAIRSETITRPVLEEIKQKRNANFVDVIKDYAAKNATLPLEQDFLCTSLNSTNFHTNISFTERGENNFKNHDEIKSSSSLVIFSSTDSINKPVTLSKLVNDEDALTSSTSSPTSPDYRQRRYEEFMNEIPSYIRQFASTINKEDVIKKKIDNLQKLFMESCQKECEENIMKSNNGGHVSTASNTFHIENPLDYIRFERERQQTTGLLSDSQSPGAGVSDETPRSPASPAPDLHVAVGIVPYDTPDYNYYPHRLN